MISSQRTLAAALWLAVAATCAGIQAQSRAAKETGQPASGRHHILPANKDTVQWGWLDPAEKPKVVVNSGDTVSIETLNHGMDEIKPGASIEEIVRLRLANPAAGRIR